MLERSAADVEGFVDVRFTVPEEVGATRAQVVGDFNEWSDTATPMTRAGDGFVVTMRLPAGVSYRFRYLVDGGRWENDWSADRYVDNDFGGHDSVIDLT